jgi:hypothetical protein
VPRCRAGFCRGCFQFALGLSNGSHARVHWIADQVRNDMRLDSSGQAMILKIKSDRGC